jgi:hypothetical protein
MAKEKFHDPYSLDSWYTKFYPNEKYWFIPKLIIEYILIGIMVYACISSISPSYKTTWHITVIKYLLLVAAVQIFFKIVIYLLVWIYRMIKKLIPVKN